ncbi:MAG TPA: regulatory protein RecX [Nitrospirota bacterium]|nr:regulatory protein RecX [Nitrospirota bacterium]
MNDKEFTRAKNTAYRLLTYRPRSRAEIVQKLGDKGFDGAIIETVVASLERMGYINDRHFAEQWASSRVRLRGYGRRRIELELRNKGVAREAIIEAFSHVFGAETEHETARHAAEKKIRTMKSADKDTRRRRLAGFLERKGFSFDVIRDVLKDMDRPN